MIDKLKSNLGKLWVSNAVSSLGDGAILSAGPLLLASVTKEPGLIAGAVFIQQLPWLLFSLHSGVLVDRFDRKKLLIGSDILRALAVVVVAAAIVAGSLSIPLIYCMLFVLGLGNTIASNAAVAFLPSVVSKDEIPSANSRLQSASIIGRQLAGPPLGSYLFVIGAAIPYGFDAATFVFAALLIGSIQTQRSTKVAAESRSKTVRQDLREGLRWLWHSHLLRRLAVSVGILNAAFAAAFATFVLYTGERLGLGPTGYGILLTLSAAGSLIGSSLSAKLQKRFDPLRLLRVSILVEGVINLLFAVVRSPLLAGAIYIAFGFNAIIWELITLSIRQKTVPESLIGRVNGVYNVFRMGGLAIGSLLGGLVAQTYGVTAPFWAAGVVVIVLGLANWPHLRQSM